MTLSPGSIPVCGSGSASTGFALAISDPEASASVILPHGTSSPGLAVVQPHVRPAVHAFYTSTSPSNRQLFDTLVVALVRTPPADSSSALPSSSNVSRRQAQLWFRIYLEPFFLPSTAKPWEVFIVGKTPQEAELFTAALAGIQVYADRVAPPTSNQVHYNPKLPVDEELPVYPTTARPSRPRSAPVGGKPRKRPLPPGVPPHMTLSNDATSHMAYLPAAKIVPLRQRRVVNIGQLDRPFVPSSTIFDQPPRPDQEAALSASASFFQSLSNAGWDINRAEGFDPRTRAAGRMDPRTNWLDKSRPDYLLAASETRQTQDQRPRSAGASRTRRAVPQDAHARSTRVGGAFPWSHPAPVPPPQSEYGSCFRPKDMISETTANQDLRDRARLAGNFRYSNVFPPWTCSASRVVPFARVFRESSDYA